MQSLWQGAFMDYIKWKTSTAWIQFKCETHLSVYNWRWWCKNVQIYSNESWETHSLTNSTNGVAAINIDSTTINTALAIPKNKGDVLPAMSDQKRIQMRLLLSELKLIIIDKISMVCNTTLLLLSSWRNLLHSVKINKFIRQQLPIRWSADDLKTSQ